MNRESPQTFTLTYTSILTLRAKLTLIHLCDRLHLREDLTWDTKREVERVLFIIAMTVTFAFSGSSLSSTWACIWGSKKLRIRKTIQPFSRKEWKWVESCENFPLLNSIVTRPLMMHANVLAGLDGECIFPLLSKWFDLSPSSYQGPKCPSSSSSPPFVRFLTSNI